MFSTSCESAVSSQMSTMKNQDSVEAMVRSKSFASLRHRPSYAGVRPTTHRRGRASNPLVQSEHLIISRVIRAAPRGLGGVKLSTKETR